MFYTGIGSRDTPDDIKLRMSVLAHVLEKRGYILRSGGARGADTAFEKGIKEDSNKRIYLPWKGFENNSSSLFTIDKEAMDSVKEFHPAPFSLSSAGQKFMARNYYQIKGKDEEKEDSKFVICWTSGGRDIGGTSQAIRIARKFDIPVFNMYSMRVEDIMEQIDLMN